MGVFWIRLTSCDNCFIANCSVGNHQVGSPLYPRRFSGRHLWSLIPLVTCEESVPLHFPPAPGSRTRLLCSAPLCLGGLDTCVRNRGQRAMRYSGCVTEKRLRPDNDVLTLFVFLSFSTWRLLWAVRPRH